MAKNTNPPSKPKPTQPRFNDVQFVNWSLDVGQKQACKDWLLSLEDMDSACGKLVEDGYKITVSFDNFRSCFTASIVPTKDAKSNQGFILTGKGSTPLKAAKQAMYIHWHVMDEDWGTYSTAKAVEELDD